MCGRDHRTNLIDLVSTPGPMSSQTALFIQPIALSLGRISDKQGCGSNEEVMVEEMAGSSNSSYSKGVSSR